MFLRGIYRAAVSNIKTDNYLRQVINALYTLLNWFVSLQ